MSINNKPSSVTQEQKDKLEQLRLAYFQARQTGSADLEAAREAYQDYAVELVIDLSGKLEPGPDQPVVTEPPKPTEGTVKEGGWGGDQDPANWHIGPMKDDPTKFKIFDGANKNIATDFSSVAKASEYVLYYRWQKDHHEPDPLPTGNVDKFGILMIKKSAASNKFETNFKLEEKERNYRSGKPSEWSTEYTNVSPEIIQNVEVTCYEKINGFKTNEPDSISLKLGGPPHQNKARFWIIPDFMTDGSAKKTLEIEDPHPYNHGINPKPLTSIGSSIVGKWFGYKGISYKTASGKRHVESWIHFPVTDIDNVKAEQANWRQYISIDVDAKYANATGKLTTSRLDGTVKGSPPEYRYTSVRDIVPA